MRIQRGDKMYWFNQTPDAGINLPATSSSYAYFTILQCEMPGANWFSLLVRFDGTQTDPTDINNLTPLATIRVWVWRNGLKKLYHEGPMWVGAIKEVERSCIVDNVSLEVAAATSQSSLSVAGTFRATILGI